MKFKDICFVLAAVRCFNAGQSIEQISKSAKVSPQSVRGRIRAAGFRRVGNKYVVG